MMQAFKDYVTCPECHCVTTLKVGGEFVCENPDCPTWTKEECMDKAEFKFPLGSTARDTITGFAGVVIARTQWLHGCTRYTVMPRELKDGKPQDGFTFDEPQLEPVDTYAVEPSTATGGGPRPEPRRW